MRVCTILFAAAIGLLAAAPAFADGPVASTLLRTAIFVKDRAATVAFYRGVMGYDEVGTGPVVGFVDAIGLPSNAKVTLTTLKSKDGAGLAIMGVESKSFGNLARAKGVANASGDVMLVHQVTGIDEIYARAKAGHYTVLRPPMLSSTGKSKQMFLRDPSGIRLELYEMQTDAK